MASPKSQHRLSGMSKPGASSCPVSPVQGSKPDRSADFAAVRNLAVSYGVDLLPLEMGFTPLRTQLKSADRSAQRLSTADSGAEHPNTPEVGETAGAAAGRGLEAAYSASSSTSVGHEADAAAAAGRVRSPGKASTASDSQLGAEQQLQADSLAPALGCFPIDVDDASDLNTESPSGMAEFIEEGDGTLLYLDEEQLPVEERVTLLEEERDILVDKLLCTTEALHASEARNRQSEASQNQVHALLEQLQELLRRAEVERDRAKMQLKRTRASSGQFMFPPLPTSKEGTPDLQADPFAIAALESATSAAAAVGLETILPQRKKSRKYRVSNRDPAAVVTETATTTASADGAGAVAGSGSADGSSTAASGTAPAATPAPAQAQQDGADSSVAALASWGSRRGSNDSSCDSSDAVSPTRESVEPAVTLTPSTDEARPPVSSVVRGFEALLNRQRSAKGSPAGSTGGRSRGELLSARSSASGGSRSASPMASRGGSEHPAGVGPATAPAGEEVLPADAVEQPVGARVTEEVRAASPADSEQPGLSESASEVFRRTYADAAVAGAEAERSRRSLAGIRAPGSTRTLGAGSSSTISTPTAAALCNTAPVGSYMLDSSCFSEEEELSVSAGGAIAPGPQRTSAQPVYNPTQYTPVQPVQAGSAHGKEEWIPGGKRGRSSSHSSSPAVTPTSQAQPALGLSSPDSAFGSVISLESPAGSVTQGGGIVTPHSGHSSSNGGSSKSKPRSASRLGMVSSPASGAAAVTAEAKPKAAAPSSKQQQEPKGRKGQGQQHGSNNQSSSQVIKQRSPRQSADGTAEVLATRTGPAGKPQKSATPAAATRPKQPAKKAAPTTQAPPTVRTSASSQDARASGSAGGSSMLRVVLAAVVLLLSALAVAVYLWSQSRVAAMEAQVQLLQKQLSQRSAECALEPEAAAAFDREL